MLLWVPEGVDPKYLAGMPDTVQTGFLPREGPLPPEAAEVEFLINPFFRRPETLRDALTAFRRLKVIQSLGAGVEWIAPYVPDGVTLCNARGLHDGPVAEWVAAAVLSANKLFFRFFDWQRQEKWEPDDTQVVAGQTLLILGYGSIGRAVEARMAPFGLDILRVARTARDDVHGLADLPALLPRADTVVVLVPLTLDTTGLVDKAFLDAMKPGALLVNAGRGKVVDTDALIEALRAGRVRAVLDVTDPEPLPAGHPLWQTPNVFLSQHTAGRTADYFDKTFGLVREQVARYLDGRPLLNVIRGAY